MKLCLVVDEFNVVRKVAKTVLNSIGYEVVEAETGQEAIEFCTRQMPDAIYIDWDLPDMSGFDFLVEFNKQFGDFTPHIVYATTETDPIDISRALKAGADDYLLIPFNRDDLEPKFPRVLLPA